jgi:hypothetical protein
MSLSFSDTTNYKGVIQEIERELSFNPGDISSNAIKLKEFTAGVNLAFDDFIALAFKSNGTWQFDDSNHTDYPIINTNLVASQRDYTFTTDEGGNLILDIFKVAVKDPSGIYQDVDPVDTQSQEGMQSFYDGINTTGTPTRYDKTANGIFLDVIPSYNSTNGLKVYINREPSYFTYTDTTKKPGVPGDLHRYFVLKPAYDYARRKNLAIRDSLQIELMRFEEKIKERFSERTRDERRRLTTTNESNK